jgi:hypothetical protein
MCNRFCKRPARVVLNVAGGAVFWRTFEDAIDVASLAADEFVGATEHKAGAQVIKSCAGLLRMGQINGAKLNQHQNHKRKQSSHLSQ